MPKQGSNEPHLPDISSMSEDSTKVYDLDALQCNRCLSCDGNDKDE